MWHPSVVTRCRPEIRDRKDRHIVPCDSHRSEQLGETRRLVVRANHCGRVGNVVCSRRGCIARGDRLMRVSNDPVHVWIRLLTDR